MKKQFTVTLKHHTPLSIATNAIRTCWDSHDKGGCYTKPTDNIVQKDKDLVNRVANKFKHASTIEHITYNFYISGVSRLLLQELARHRMTNLSVKSTRYTLKELKDGYNFNIEEYDNMSAFEAMKYLVFTGNQKVDMKSYEALCNLQDALKQGISNDIAKYCLPESYKTELTWTINARSLQNFLGLRTSKAALEEIRLLALEIFEQIPEEHKFLFKDSIYSKEQVIKPYVAPESYENPEIVEPYISGFEVEP